jgi:hypothetical protein
VAVRGLVPPIAFPLDHFEQMATDPVDVMSKHCRPSAPAARGDEWTNVRLSDKGRLYRWNQVGFHVGLEDISRCAFCRSEQRGTRCRRAALQCWSFQTRGLFLGNVRSCDTGEIPKVIMWLYTQ